MKYFFQFSGGDDQLSSNELKSPTRNETLLIWWLIIPIIRVIQQLFLKNFLKRKKFKKTKQIRWVIFHQRLVSKFLTQNFSNFFTLIGKSRKTHPHVSPTPISGKFIHIWSMAWMSFPGIGLRRKFKLGTVRSKKSKKAPRSKNMFIDFGFWTVVLDIGNTLNNIWRNVEETSRESFTGNNTLGT